MRALTILVFIVAFAGVSALALFAPPVEYVQPSVWALLIESLLSAVIALAITTMLFWVLDSVPSIREIVLPGRDEARMAERAVATILGDAAATPNDRLSGAILFTGLALRGAARILALAVIYGVTLWTFAPLA